MGVTSKNPLHFPLSQSFTWQPYVQPRCSPLVEHLSILNVFFLEWPIPLEVSNLIRKFKWPAKGAERSPIACGGLGGGLRLALSPPSGRLLTFKLFVCTVGSLRWHCTSRDNVTVAHEAVPAWEHNLASTTALISAEELGQSNYNHKCHWLSRILTQITVGSPLY